MILGQDNKKKFKLFDMNRDGKGVYEEENRKPTFLFFFKLLKRKLSHILRLNLMMLVQIVPILVFIYLYIGGTKTPTTTSLLYSTYYGISKISPSAFFTGLLDMQSIHMGLPVFHPAVVIVLICLALLLAITFGWINVGAAYVLRGLFRGDPVFIVADFFYAIKRNLKQAFFMGLIDIVCIIVLVADFIYFYNRTGTSFMNDFMYFMIFALAIIYVVMRFYMYQMLITFNLSNFKILKNSLIFTVLGIKRNIVALLFIVLLIVLHIVVILMSLSVGISIPLILPLFYIMALMGFISTYAAYPVIDKYMIAPYASQKASDDSDDDDGYDEDAADIENE